MGVYTEGGVVAEIISRQYGEIYSSEGEHGGWLLRLIHMETLNDRSVFNVYVCPSS